MGGRFNLGNIWPCGATAWMPSWSTGARVPPTDAHGVATAWAGRETRPGRTRLGAPIRNPVSAAAHTKAMVPPDSFVSSRLVTEFRLQLAIDADELVDFEVGGRPAEVIRYSVVLRYLGAGQATAVRVYDNSHGRDEHHMHRCDRGGRRQQPPEIFHYGEPYEALQEARNLVENGFEEMISGWLR